MRQDWLAKLSRFLRIPSVSADPARAADVLRADERVAERVVRLGGTAGIQPRGPRARA